MSQARSWGEIISPLSRNPHINTLVSCVVGFPSSYETMQLQLCYLNNMLTYSILLLVKLINMLNTFRLYAIIRLSFTQSLRHKDALERTFLECTSFNVIYHKWKKHNPTLFRKQHSKSYFNLYIYSINIITKLSKLPILHYHHTGLITNI